MIRTAAVRQELSTSIFHRRLLGIFVALLWGGALGALGLSDATASDAMIGAQNLSIEQSPDKRVTPRIVGGQLATESYPWMVSLQVANRAGSYAHFCGGVLIDARTVLTAAHCVVDYTAEQLRVAIGEPDLSRVGRSDRWSLAEIIMHPGYDVVSLDNDVALLRLTEAVTAVQPVTLPPLTGSQFDVSDSDAALAALPGDTLLPGIYESGRLADTGVSYRILGWGAIDSAATVSVVSDLREADLKVFSRTACQNGLNDTTFCAGELDGSVDSCLGDSGGPLLRVRPSTSGQDAFQYELMGLVSYGNGTQCAQRGILGFYTDVQRYLPFIHGITSGRDHWVPLRWVGQGFPSRVRVPITNYTRNTYFFDVWSGRYAGGVEIQANDCEQATLAPDQRCSLSYQLVPEALGAQTVSTALPFAVSAGLGNSQAAEKRVMGQVHVLRRLNVGQAFQVPGVTWFSGGTDDSAGGGASWVLDERTVAAGAAALRSPPLGDRQTSVLQGYFEGPQQIDAYVLVDSESDFDFLTVSMAGETVFSASGYSGWQRVGLSIPPAGATVRFDYVKDGTWSEGRDAVWVDFVSPMDDITSERFLVDAGVTTLTESSGSGGSMNTLFGLLVGVFGVWRRQGLGQAWRRAVVLLTCVLVTGGGVGCAGKPSAELGKEAEGASAAASTALQPSSAASAGDITAGTTKTAKGAKEMAVEEPLYSKHFDGHRLTVQVRTLGCTQAKSFRLVESADQPGWYTVMRVQPDYCRRAPMIMTVNISIPEAIARQIKSSDHPTQMRLTNVAVPSVGLPIIPPAVNP